MVMFRLRPIRKNAKAPRGLRGVEAAFWFVLALAVGIGGSSALSGLPRLGELLLTGDQFAAEAHSEPKPGLVTLTLARLTQTPVAPAAAKAPAASLPAIAIVIDDMGADVAQGRRAIALPRAVALSFLPYPEETSMLARAGARAGHEILVHVPMQAEDDENPGPMALRIDQPPQEAVRRLEWALSRVPGFAGINNHMGSRFTEDRAALVPVIEALYGRRIFFFDSRTSAASQVVPVARAFGVPSAARDVFLDDLQKPEAVAAQLSLLQKDARVGGAAIAIGHPHDVTLGVLARWCANPKGFRLVPVSVAIRIKTEREILLAALAR
jgi:polysaccharide deacetylase 2 family uncharacterized protein YibQ